MGTVKAQNCCNPPVAQGMDLVKWPKGTVIHVKIQTAFDEIEVEAIKAAFREWNARKINNCSNVSYPEPYELVATPPKEAISIMYNIGMISPRRSPASAELTAHLASLIT